MNDVTQPETTVARRPARPARPVLAWLRLARVFQKVDQASEQHLRRFGLSTAQFDLLAQIGVAEGATQQEMANSLLVTKSNVCQLLVRLERAGLVQRRPAGRAKRLYLTPAGRALFDQVVPSQEQLVTEQFAALSPGGQAKLLGLLRTLDRALG
jgi:DNA-binding MarR family transcriptional regulator